MENKDKNNLIMVLLVVLVLALFLGFGSFGGGMMYGFGGVWMIIALISAIWVIYDVLVNNKGLSDGMKLLWIIFAIVFSIITAIVYYLVKNQNNDLFRKNGTNRR